MHPLNVVAAVADVDSLEEKKNRRLRLKLNFWLVCSWNEIATLVLFS